MKKGILFITLILSLSLASAQECSLTATLINQDPYPAVPGDYVKLVFQIIGTGSSDCGEVSVRLIEDYPIFFDPNVSQTTIIQSGTFARTYNSALIVPYKVRIDDSALNGENPIELQYIYGKDYSKTNQIKRFNLTLEDVKVDFEVAVKDYIPLTNILTLEILNIGKSDIKALTIEIPEQEIIKVKGANRNIVGDLDSNDYTTADFEATPLKGEIVLNLIYTDSINIRRIVQEKVNFNPEYFIDRNNGTSETSIWTYLVILVILVGVVYWIIRRRNRKRAAHLRTHNH